MRTDHDTTTLPSSNRRTPHHSVLRRSGGSFYRVVVLTQIILTWAVISPRPAKAGSYYIANYPTDQNGHNISGTITTDGTLGTLAAKNIISWSVTIDGTTFTNTDPNAETLVSGTGLNAALTSITLAEAAIGEFNALQFDINNASVTSPSIDWHRSPSAVPGVNTDLYLGSISEANTWFTENPSMGGTNPWLIAAAVPEPSTALLASIGAVVAFLAYGWSHHRVQRRQAAA